MRNKLKQRKLKKRQSDEHFKVAHTSNTLFNTALNHAVLFALLVEMTVRTNG